MSTNQELNRLLQTIEQNGVDVNKRIHGFTFPNLDFVSPHITILMCWRGTARIMYDMQERTIKRNDMNIILPGHLVHPIDNSDDFTYARIFISAELFDDLKHNLFSHDFDKFNYIPECHLTDEQAHRMRALGELLAAIASHDTDDLQLRRQMLIAQLALGYEFVNYYRKEQDREWKENNPSTLYARFCDLVVNHYRENRNVNYYARLLGYDTRYFSKLFRKTGNGISALDWIGQYVTTQAKRIMDANPKQTIKETAYQLGFPTTANFCRYFKRVTGIYPQEYKKQNSNTSLS